MMANKMIKMELLSDLCPASGDAFAGYVDTDVCFDDLGFPYIPAKRIKGCLRECGLDIISVDDSFEPVFNQLFGETGSFMPGAMKIENGKLENYAKEDEMFGNAHRSEFAEIYTSTRSRTKIENGKAAKGTLRTTRVLNKGQVYEFPVTLPEHCLAFFELCVKTLRGVGLNRTRGLGEVVCSLVDVEQDCGIKFNFNIEQIGALYVFSYQLELLAPVITTSRNGNPADTEDYIFGSTMLGAFAAKYIAKNSALHRAQAHEDKTFRTLFLENNVIFTAALPFENNRIYYPAPSVLRTDKLQTRLFDETLNLYDGDNKNPICKRLGGFISVSTQGVVKKTRPNKITFLHHARPKDRSVGHPTKNDGEFFSYEALAAGQTFCGSVMGSKADIEILAGLFDDKDTLSIGRSRTAQYGTVKITPLKNAFETNALTLKKEDKFRLVAVTPIILEDENGVNKTDIRIVAKMLGNNYEVVRYSCAETIVSGYNAKWLLPRKQERAIAEGSTIVMQFKGDHDTLSQNYIGKRTGEGFGQVRVESIPEATAFTLEKESTAKSPDSNLPPPTAIEQLRKQKAAILNGAAYGESRAKFAPQNASLSRLLSALENAKSFDEFAKMLTQIKQPSQKVAALSFATKKDKFYFKTDAAHLGAAHIAIVLADIGYDYTTYRTYLTAAVQRIKQNRRSGNSNKEGGEPT